MQARGRGASNPLAALRSKPAAKPCPTRAPIQSADLDVLISTLQYEDR